jgi:hypothetical protein
MKKNSFRNLFLIGMIIPATILLLIIVILTMYKVHDYNQKKSLIEIERLKIENLKKKSAKPIIIKRIEQKNDSSLTNKSVEIIETTVNKIVKDIDIKQTKTNISDTNKSKKVIISKSDTINEAIYKPDTIKNTYKPDTIKNID